MTLTTTFHSKYYDIDQIQTLKFPNKHKYLALFHIKACSLNKNFDDLGHLLKCTNNVFDIIAVLNIYISNQLESTFVEIINHKKVILSLVVFRNIQI